MSSSQKKKTNKSGENADGQESGSVSGKGSGKGGPTIVHPHLGLPCPICLLPFEEPAITQCGHIFCIGCLNLLASNSMTFPRCPLCRQTL